MELADDKTVLGDFNNQTLENQGVKTRFFRQGKDFMVNTDGPTGKPEDYKIKYTFGVRPLQQYLVEFPDGRVQCLSTAWDTKQKRWFDLHPDEPHPARRLAALDQGRPELELHVRRVPQHRLEEELRPQE